MTTLMTDCPLQCAVCDQQSRHTLLYSQSSFWPDFGPALDTRPSELQLEFCIQVCPSCRYCARDISQGIPGAAGIVASPAYREQFESTKYPEVANRFLCWGMILQAAGDLAMAGWANTLAAWHCDDEAAKSTGCDYQTAGSLMTEYRAFLLTCAVILRAATLGRVDLRHRAVWGRYHEDAQRRQVVSRCRRGSLPAGARPRAGVCPRARRRGRDHRRLAAEVGAVGGGPFPMPIRPG